MTFFVRTLYSDKGVDLINDVLMEARVAEGMRAVFGHFLELFLRLLHLADVALLSMVFLG